MGKPTGFMEFQRLSEAYEAKEARLKHYKEFVHHLSDDQAAQQGARCMDCGIPFCSSGCPVNNIIPDWNDLVYRGNWKQAIEVLHSTNNFPEVTGRICPAPCETACTLNINTDPVGIKSIEHAIIDKAGENGWVRPQPPPRKTGKKVAVVGSGPAGLACAQQLARVGHHVTVFEKNSRIGGLMRYGIPDFKLDKRLIDWRMAQLEAEGVKFAPGVMVTGSALPQGVANDAAKTIPADKLVKDFDAVVLAGGAEHPRDLPVPGRDLAGVHFALEFLIPQNKEVAGDGKNPLSAKGKHVVVIGGGDTGTDCVGTSLRHGCKSVIQLEIMPKPPMERAADNPWPEWPKVYKMDYGQEEAAAVQGQDPRSYLVQTKRFIKDDAGNVSGLEICEIEWGKDEQGRFVPKEKEGSARVIPAQLVLLAMGFLGPEQAIVKQFALETDARSNVKADHGKFTTNIEGVFAAGDMRRGQSLVVWAINEGRGAAREADRFLMGVTHLP